MKKIIAIIPAKKKSYRIKNKNLLKFKGQTLVEKTAKDALKSKKLYKIYLSSDCERIRKKIKKFKNIEILSKRTSRFSGKNATMHSVVKHELRKIKINYDYIMILQPTSPLRNYQDIDKACDLISKRNLKADSLISCTHLPEEYEPKKIMVQKNSHLEFLDLKAIFLNNLKINKLLINKKKFKFMKNQNTKNLYYFRNGAIFITSKKKISDYIVGGKIINYEMPFSRSLDINNYSDLEKLNLFKF